MRKHTTETKLKISKANKGRKLTEETRKRMSQAQKGHPFRGKRNYIMSEDAKERIRKGILEKRYTQEYARKLSNSKRGALNPIAKLTREDVDKIRETYNSSKISQQKLANQYGVHRSTIADILKYRTWNH